MCVICTSARVTAVFEIWIREQVNAASSSRMLRRWPASLGEVPYDKLDTLRPEVPSLDRLLDLADLDEPIIDLAVHRSWIGFRALREQDAVSSTTAASRVLERSHLAEPTSQEEISRGWVKFRTTGAGPSFTGGAVTHQRTLSRIRGILRLFFPP